MAGTNTQFVILTFSWIMAQHTFAKQYSKTLRTPQFSHLRPTYYLCCFLLVVGVALSTASTGVAATTDSSETADLEAQHALYRQTLIAINKGHRTRTREGMEALADYPLFPYLEKAELSRKLRQLPYEEVNDFLSRHDETVVGKRLRREWLVVLSDKKEWQQFLKYYDPELAGQNTRCWHLEALHQTGLEKIALEQTTDIWLSGKSLPDSCDPAFKRWQQAGYQTDELVWQRTKLALLQKNTLLARYLSKRASAYLKPYTRRLISVYRDPQRLTDADDFADSSPYNTDILSIGLQRLASRDADMATKLWVDYRGYKDFSPAQYSQIRDKIARQVIASGDGKALPWLITHDPNAEDSYLLEWRIRLSLKQQQWSKAENWISLLPAELRADPRWRYWLARSWQQQDKHPRQSESLLQQLAGERHYYGFLAADASQFQYGFNHSALPDSNAAPLVANDPAIIRSKYFYQMGELIPARREWNQAVKHFEESQLIAATAIAHQWGWHQQAINTTIKANHWNDLDVRFPLAYQQNMLASANSVTIRPEWLYAIARQESAFAQDAYSPVGARGLLQLLPSTAQRVAKRIGVNYDQRELFQADKNITLGSNYLKELLDDFQGNHILATAAYNAGPYRVKRWLKQQGQALPYDIWIETLPFYETRNYVQNVLAFSVIYGHRLGINSRLIGQNESVIGTPAKIPAVQTTALKSP